MMLLFLLLILPSLDAAISMNNAAAVETLLEYLQQEICGIYLVGLTDVELLQISSSLLKPYHVIAAAEETLSSLVNAREECRAIVTNDLDWNLTNVFQRRYVLLSLVDVTLWKQSQVEIPTTVFAPKGNGQAVIFSWCPNAQSPRVNLWKPDIGYMQGRNEVTCSNALKNKVMRVKATGGAPYVSNGKNGRLRGVDISIMDIIAEKLGFQYNVSYEQLWGSKIEGSSQAWSGVIGKVVNGSADFGIGQMLMQYDRNNVVDFTTPVYANNMHLVAAKPKILTSEMNFLKPFTVLTWIPILGTVVATTLIMTVIMHYSSMLLDGKDHSDWADLIFIFYKLHLQSCVTVKSRHSAPWILLSCYSIYAFFINASFLCDFRAVMMQAHYEKPIDSEQDLVSQGKNLYFAKVGSNFIELFANSPLKIQRDIFKASDTKQLYFVYENGDISKVMDERIINEGSAFLTGKYQAIASLPRYEKRLGYVPYRVGKKAILSFYSGFTLRKKSFWKQEVDNVLLHLVESGIIHHLEKKSILSRYLRETELDKTPKPFPMENLLGCFYFLIVGSSIALVMLCFELLFICPVLKMEEDLIVIA